MKIKILIECDDPNDIAKPPQIKIYQWEELDLMPLDLYNMLSNVKGNLFCRI